MSAKEQKAKRQQQNVFAASVLWRQRFLWKRRVWSRKAAGACLARRLQCPLRLEYLEQKRSSPANLAFWVGLSTDHNVFPLFQSTNYTLRGSNCRTFIYVGGRGYRTSEPLHMLDASHRAEFCASEITNWRTAVIGGYRFCKRISDYLPLTLGKSWCLEEIVYISVKYSSRH